MRLWQALRAFHLDERGSVNTLRLRDIFPTAKGFGTVYAGQASAPSGVTTAQARLSAGLGAQSGPVTGAPLTLGSGLATWLAFLGLVVGFMLIGQRVGPAEDFRSIRLTFFNALAISLLAIVGILFWKFVFFTVKIPYVSDLVAGT